MPADLSSFQPALFCYDPTRVGSDGWYDESSGCLATRNVLPALPPSSDERIIGRWHLSQGDRTPVLWVDLLMDENGIGGGSHEHGSLSSTTALAAEARCLVTSENVYFACYSGQVSRYGKLNSSTAVVFKLPLREITAVDPGQSNALRTGSPLVFALERWGASVSVKKAAAANEKFGSGVFATAKNKEFAAQVEATRRG